MSRLFLLLGMIALSGCAVRVDLPPYGEHRGRYGQVGIEARYYPTIDAIAAVVRPGSTLGDK